MVDLLGSYTYTVLTKTVSGDDLKCVLINLGNPHEFDDSKIMLRNAIFAPDDDATFWKLDYDYDVIPRQVDPTVTLSSSVGSTVKQCSLPTITVAHTGFTQGAPLSIAWSVTSVLDVDDNAVPSLVTEANTALTSASPLYEFTIPSDLTTSLAGHEVVFSVTATEAFTDQTFTDTLALTFESTEEVKVVLVNPITDYS